MLTEILDESKIINALATMAEGKHPFPSRTRSLSLPAPMVLSAGAYGRVGVARAL